MSSAVFADVEGSNIVGYNARNSAGQKTPLVGGMFLPVNGDATYDRSALSMKVVDKSSDDDYLDPGSDYIRFMDVDSAAITDEYCYIGQEFLDLIECYEKTEAIGWWQYDPSVDYSELIAEDIYDLKVKTPVTIKVGQGFLGQFLKSTDGGEHPHKVSLVSSGSVPLVATAFNSAGLQTPMLCNYLPVDTSLFNVTMSMKDKVSDDDYLDPGSDYLRFMDVDSAAITDEYCYIGQEFLDLIECSEKTEAIGWWQYDPSVDYSELIAEDDYNLKLKADIPLKAGEGVLGQFLKSIDGGEHPHQVLVNFKSALEATPAAE